MTNTPTNSNVRPIGYPVGTALTSSISGTSLWRRSSALSMAYDIKAEASSTSQPTHGTTYLLRFFYN